MQTFTTGILSKSNGSWQLEVRHILQFDNPGDAIRFAEAINRVVVPEIPVDPEKLRQTVEEALKTVARRQSVIVNW